MNRRKKKKKEQRKKKRRRERREEELGCFVIAQDLKMLCKDSSENISLGIHTYIYKAM